MASPLLAGSLVGLSLALERWQMGGGRQGLVVLSGEILWHGDLLDPEVSGEEGAELTGMAGGLLK